MSQPTPGPWPLRTELTSAGICHMIGAFPNHGTRENYACVYADGVRAGSEAYDPLGAELLANARLIAAAPDLLAAARAVIQANSGGFTHGENEPSPLAMLRAAVAKAEGVFA